MKIIGGYSEQLLGKNLHTKYNAKIIRKNEEAYLEIGGETIHLNVGLSHGMLDEEGVNNIVKMVSEITGEKQEGVYREITKKPNFQEKRIPTGLERQVIPGALILLSVALITLVLSHANLLTGYAISDISNTTSNVGIFICVAGILGLLYYRNKIK
jgi:hypothetical protein